ncbi:outer membrane beta-barrel protein [Sporocytophaga myxococcoides]|uniref:outer membrane beta-barrel protein n=1 Tax=Sporocytophaga myxococcoides TaxID=153721 RepID=UPI0003FBADF6|nr:outer membrane beta-barrel protein [Sporocytophaga myxococcoides]
MKKQLLSIALLLASLTSFAQLEQGKLLLGGRIGISSTSPNTVNGGTTVDGVKTTSYFVTPAIGYFIAENFALGLNIGFGGYTEKTPANAGTPELKDKNPYFLIGPFGRYYKKFGDNFAVFGQAAIDFRFGKNKNETYNAFFNRIETTENKTSYFSPNIRPGIVFFPYSKVGIELLVGRIGYTHSVVKFNDDSKSKNNSVDFNFDLANVQLGVFLYL